VLSMIDARMTRLALLLLILGVFLVIPLRMLAYGYMPPDDAMRHAAFAVVDRNWGDLILLDPRFPAWMDPHAGWHALLRAVHTMTQWDQGALVNLSVVLGLWVFTFGGVLASGNPPAWLLSSTLMVMLEPALFGKLTLGRPLGFSMAAVMLLLFLWTRRQALHPLIEAGIVGLVLSVSLYLHPTSWYLWAVAVPPLVACRRWRALGTFLAGWGIALLVAILLNGWYNAIQLPLDIMQLAVLQGGTLGPNLVTELQPSGAPVFGLMGMVLILLARKAMGHDVRGEIYAIDLAFVVTAWVLGLYVSRFWVEWGLPAMAVWYTRQIGEEMGLGFAELHRRPVPPMFIGLAAATLYLTQTADQGGRFTNALRNPLLIVPREELASDLPEPGGVLYDSDMGHFYVILHRIPELQFRFATAMEPGLMPAEDLKVLRAIQTTGTVKDHAPWFEKMRTIDRVVLRSPSEPQWPNMEFKRFFGGWIGRKVRS